MFGFLELELLREWVSALVLGVAPLGLFFTREPKPDLLLMEEFRLFYMALP